MIPTSVRRAVEPILIPPGFGLRMLPPDAVTTLSSNFLATDQAVDRSQYAYLYDKMLVWEAPRKRHRYVIGVDVSGGMGLDRSVVDVTRIGTLHEPDEQVAQFVTGTLDPADLAYVIDAAGRFYKDKENNSALVAIECNGLGLGTQSELIRHLGYENLFIWQYEDAATPEGRYTRKYGWWTSIRTRPLIVGRYIKAVRSLDPVTGKPDYLINSPFTLEELADFQTTGALYDACAADGAWDDCIMAGAIAVHVAQTEQFDSSESTTEHRRRLNEERARAETEGTKTVRRDFRNTDCTYDDYQRGYSVEDV